MIYPNTEIADAAHRVEFQEVSELERVQEVKALLEKLNTHTLFSSQHISSMISINGFIPEDKDKMLLQLKEIINEIKSMKEPPKYTRRSI